MGSWLYQKASARALMEDCTASPRGLDVSRQPGPSWGQERVSPWCLGSLQPMGRLGQGLSSGRGRSLALLSCSAAPHCSECSPPRPWPGTCVSPAEASFAWNGSPELGNQPPVADTTLGNADIVIISSIINNKPACNGGVGSMAESSAPALSTLCKRLSWSQGIKTTLAEAEP